MLFLFPGPFRTARYVTKAVLGGGRRRTRRCQPAPSRQDQLGSIVFFVGFAVVTLLTLAAAEITHSGAVTGWVLMLGLIANLVAIIFVMGRAQPPAGPPAVSPRPPAPPEPLQPRLYWSNRR